MNWRLTRNGGLVLFSALLMGEQITSREAFGYMKRWFQAPRIEALEHAIRFTAETRKGRNSEVTDLVQKFFEKT